MAALETVISDPNISDSDLDLVDALMEAGKEGMDKATKDKNLFTLIDQQMKIEVLNNALASVIAHRLKKRGV